MGNSIIHLAAGLSVSPCKWGKVCASLLRQRVTDALCVLGFLAGAVYAPVPGSPPAARTCSDGV